MTRDERRIRDETKIHGHGWMRSGATTLQLIRSPKGSENGLTCAQTTTCGQTRMKTKSLRAKSREWIPRMTSCGVTQKTHSCSHIQEGTG